MVIILRKRMGAVCMSSGSLSKDIEKNIAFFQPYVDENADLSMRRVVTVSYTHLTLPTIRLV